MESAIAGAAAVDIIRSGVRPAKSCSLEAERRRSTGFAVGGETGCPTARPEQLGRRIKSGASTGLRPPRRLCRDRYAAIGFGLCSGAVFLSRGSSQRTAQLLFEGLRAAETL
jgi:hypothetical protein